MAIKLKVKMNRIVALLAAIFPCILHAHPCPHDWNIFFKEETEIQATSLSDFVMKFNEAVSKETEGKIPKAIIYEPKPDTFLKVSADSPFAEDMDVLIQRYIKVTDPLKEKGFREFGTAPMHVSFTAKFHVACFLAMEFGEPFTTYDEIKEGAKVTLCRSELECRSYKVSDKFLDTVAEWEREGHIPAGVKATPYVFARRSQMTWAFYTTPDPKKDNVEHSILEGVTLYLPEKKIMLVIDTKAKHEQITKGMLDRQYIEVTEPKQDPEKP